MTAGIYNRGTAAKPNYWIRYRDAEGALRRESGSEGRGPCRSHDTAERLLRRRHQQVTAGTLEDEVAGRSRRMSFAAYMKGWLDKRENRSKSHDVQRLEKYALPAFGARALEDITRKQYRKFIFNLTQGTLAPKTIRNVHAITRKVFVSAFIDELIFVDPSLIPKEELPEVTDQRTPEVFTGPEAMTLMQPSGEPGMHIFVALGLYTGMRQGEIVGRRWRDLDGDALNIRTQYNDRPLKTGKPRVAPLHPELERILRDWARSLPIGVEFIVQHEGRQHTKNTSYKAWVRHCEFHGIEARGVHALRHTMVTTARRGGADKDWLGKVTHNPKGDVLDRYTASQWEPMRTAVECVRYDVTPSDAVSGHTWCTGVEPAAEMLVEARGIEPGGETSDSPKAAANSTFGRSSSGQKRPETDGVSPGEHSCVLPAWSLAFAAESLGLGRVA